MLISITDIHQDNKKVGTGAPTCTWNNFSEKWSVLQGIRKGQRGISDCVDADPHADPPSCSGWGSAVDFTGVDRENSARFVPNSDSGVAWTEAIACDHQSSSTTKASRSGCDRRYCGAADTQVPQGQALASHHNTHGMKSSRERSHKNGDVIVVHVGCSELLASDENSNVLQGSAETFSFNLSSYRSADRVGGDSCDKGSDAF